MTEKCKNCKFLATKNQKYNGQATKRQTTNAAKHPIKLQDIAECKDSGNQADSKQYSLKTIY
jgi:hypothetical protein